MKTKHAGSHLFRKVARERLSSPEQLDQIMRITSPAGWVALLALGLLLASAVVWGFKGSIPTKVEGSGILMSRGGIFSISARAAGTVQAVFFQEGNRVGAGQVVATIGEPDIRDKILAAEDKIKELKARYDQQRGFGLRQLALEKRSISAQRADLLQTNQALKTQLKVLEKRMKDQDRLVELGLITRKTALNTQIQIDDRTETIRQNQNKIERLSIQELQTRSRIDEDLLGIQNQIESARAQLYSLQNILEEDADAVSVYTGTIISVDVKPGDVVQKGSQLMTVELTGEHSRLLEAVLYFPASQGKKVVQGMRAHVSPLTVKKDQYGSIIGLVTSVSPFPAGPDAMKSVLQNEEMVQNLSKNGAPIEIRVALVPDSRTFSWYKWTSSNGPPVAIAAGTVCTGSAIVKRQPPIQLVIPLMKKYVLGIGQGQNPWER